jgi:predicted RND superfamily exporter protein
VRTRLIDFIINRASVIVLVALILASYSCYGLVDFRTPWLLIDVDASLMGLLPVRGEALETFKRVRDRFGGDDILLVAWFDDELFTSDVLRRLKRFSRRAQRMEGVKGVDRLLRRLPKKNTTLDNLKADALASPLYRGQLVSNDGCGALIAIHFEPDLAFSDLKRAVSSGGCYIKPLHGR